MRSTVASSMARRLLARSLASHAHNATAPLHHTAVRAAAAHGEQLSLSLPVSSHRRSFQTTALRCAAENGNAKPPVDTEDGGKEENGDDDDDEYAEEDWDDDDEEEEEFDDEDEEGEEVEVDPEDEGAVMAAQYVGVKYNPSKVKKYSAELELDGHIIVGGDYWTALDAAKGYDELVDLYCDLETPRNFPAGSEQAELAAAAASGGLSAAGDVPSEWEVPDAGKRNADIIPPIPQTYLTLDEVLAALEREKAIDVYTVDLAGKSSLADFMVFTTGRSQAHMRRMADMLIQSMKARNIEDEFDYSVEGRDCDDWMIADCNNIVVHFMREDTRRILNLEHHWEHMENDKHKVYGDMTEDEYMDKFGTSELMEYLEDDDFAQDDDVEATDDSGSKRPRGDIDWK
ncbi:hypothetical protein PINS_up023050 [Pythium insidiosum]|nr:hypothetical protein PINS_up023050 [Pythium insidiosum]